MPDQPTLSEFADHGKESTQNLEEQQADTDQDDLDRTEALAEAVSHLATIADRNVQNTDRIKSLEKRAQGLREETATDHLEDLRGFY
ncbi:hypothetical protein HAPAU_42190 [Halalkalicoccus paucihalophilus]|uniref:Uncharacterized protein n=1 Tax=Halalkalicoccus paucihalophilus TaxID=1008153 RepID=A0A151A7Z4_9EURY|nr:hypothetical protein [Halalkalicoccus paucihalophilus]KYH23739.1 hypothetical protein HAPAU_42190 [Halalkalicoccus paucihalophilus]